MYGKGRVEKIFRGGLCLDLGLKTGPLKIMVRHKKTALQSRTVAKFRNYFVPAILFWLRRINFYLRSRILMPGILVGYIYNFHIKDQMLKRFDIW